MSLGVSEPISDADIKSGVPLHQNQLMKDHTRTPLVAERIITPNQHSGMMNAQSNQIRAPCRRIAAVESEIQWDRAYEVGRVETIKLSTLKIWIEPL